MTNPNVSRALNVLSNYLEQYGVNIATASNADDVLNAFDAMRANLREEAYRTLLENKQKLFSDLRSVSTSFGLVIQSMAALGQDTKLMQKLQGTITKITADLSFTGEDDQDNDGVRDDAVQRGADGEPTLDLDTDTAVQHADELFQGMNNEAPIVPAEKAAEQAMQENAGGFADDIGSDDAETAAPGTGGMADDFEENKSLDQAVDEASQPKPEEAPAETEDQGEGGAEGGPFDSIPDGDAGSPFDGTSNEGAAVDNSGGAAPVADEANAPSDEDLNNLFESEFPSKKAAPAPAPAAPAAPAPAPNVAQSSVEVVSYDGVASIKRNRMLLATAADGSIAFYTPDREYLDGDTEAVASLLGQIAQNRGADAATRTFNRLIAEGNIVVSYKV